MTNKTLKHVIPAQKVNMGGNYLDQPLPTDRLDHLDPFLLIHHWHNFLPGGQRPQEAGVGPHPHRGFSPVTFIFKGAVEHRDSLGQQATVEAGGTQWMFAGRGITHSERFPRDLVENGGELEFIQFWVNAPSAHKMEAPFYKPIAMEETPLVEEKNSKIWVVSGDYKGTKGVAPTYSPQTLLRGELKIGGEVTIAIPKSYNTLIYVLEGGVKTDEKTLLTKDMGVFNTDGDAITITATADSRYIVLSGEPINEPVAQYGPFVMSDQTQVMQAIRDSQMGKMGILIEEFD
ncbi:pirin family protein [Bacteroidia bacterium]|nr:pirin family protein [Bacteroidia bacterium]MDB9881813.1 pirin family protein [Bacteroidia bacterium]MDC1395010.1 pirin family protein [Bacteroidia bacterium]